MAKVAITKSKMDSLANSIAAKSGVPVTMTVDEMKTAVDSILVPAGTLTVTENGVTDVTAYENVDVDVFVPEIIDEVTVKSISYDDYFHTYEPVVESVFPKNSVIVKDRIIEGDVSSLGITFENKKYYLEVVFGCGENYEYAAECNQLIDFTSSDSVSLVYKDMDMSAYGVELEPGFSEKVTSITLNKNGSLSYTYSGEDTVSIIDIAGIYVENSGFWKVDVEPFRLKPANHITPTDSEQMIYPEYTDEVKKVIVEYASDFVNGGTVQVSIPEIQKMEDFDRENFLNTAHWYHLYGTFKFTRDTASLILSVDEYFEISKRNNIIIPFTIDEKIDSQQTTWGSLDSTILYLSYFYNDISFDHFSLPDNTRNEISLTITEVYPYDGISYVQIDPIPSEYIIPSGSIAITQSGTTDVTDYASATVAAGTEGVPTATKGTVSNHSVAVTPSVTNTAGYITGSTKTGTAVTVSASELVSGSQTIDENDTYDVTNLASVIVNVEGEPGQARIVDTPDGAGGTIRSITTGEETILTTKTVTPNDETQEIICDDYVCALTYSLAAADVTAGELASVTTDFTPSTTLIDNQNYRITGRINIWDSNNQIIEYYDINAVFTWNTTYQNIVENDSNAYYEYFAIKKPTNSKNLSLERKAQKTGHYGYKCDCKVYKTEGYNGLSKVTVNPIPGTYYSPDLIKKMIQRNSNFTTFNFPDGITAIGKHAFAECASLALTSLPSSITYIDNYAFYNCTNIALTNLPSNVTSIGGNAFYNCTKLALTSLPDGVTYLYSYTFYNCTNLALTSLPSGITNIDQYTFYTCTKLALTSLPSSLTSIGNYAFKNCTGLTSITCDGIITTLAQYAFSGDSTHHMQLTSARFPNMALTSNINTVFGSSTAANACQELEICDIGTTTGINSNAFANCYKLQTLILRKTSVCTLAGTSAFTNTPLSGYNGLTATVYVPSSLISSYQTASNWSTLYNAGNVTFSKIEGSIYELS